MRLVTLIVVLLAAGGAALSGNWPLWLAGGAIVILCLWGWHLHDKDRSERSQGLAAALSVGALLAGIYWYMVDRPSAPKINLKLSGQAFPADDGRALLFLSVELENVGNTRISFDDDDEPDQPSPPAPPAAGKVALSDVDCAEESGAAAPAGEARAVMKVRLGKVAPVGAGLKARLGCATLPAPPGSQASLARADLWPPLGKVDQDLVTKIEAGETESYYYRALVPCEAGLALSATARIPKRGAVTDTLIRQDPAGHVWIGQTIIDFSAVCAQSRKGPTK